VSSGVCVVCSPVRDCRAACVLSAVQSESVERRMCCVQCRVRLKSGVCVVCSAE